MSMNMWAADHMPPRFDGARSNACARHPVRLPILSLFQTGLLMVLVVTSVLLTRAPALPEESSPAWSMPTGHPQGGVQAVTFAPDGRRLATGGVDGSVVIWEVGNGAQKELSDHPQSRVVRLAFSPDGTTLASGHASSAVVLWNVMTGKERVLLAGHANDRVCLDFSPDGATLATGGEEPGIRLWDVASGKIKATLRARPGAVRCVRFSPDGRTLASGYNAGLVELWDVSTGERRHSLGPGNKGYAVQNLAFSGDGLTLASGGVCDNLRLWDVATGLERVSLPTEVAGIREVVFSDCGQTLVALKYDGSVLFRGLSARSERTICVGTSGTRCSAFSPDRSLLVLGDLDGIVRVWDLNRFLLTGPEMPVLDR
jgi:WD40 repeat protein